MIRPDEETGSFVAYCPALDLYSAGKTRIDAKRAIQGAVDMYIRLCYDRGILDRLLHAKGFTSMEPATAGATAQEEANFISVIESKHQAEYDDIFSLSVPMHLVAAAKRAEDGTCRQ
jgi:predicted RNase H-like HicB family nuclease